MNVSEWALRAASCYSQTVTWYVGTGLNHAFCHLQCESGTKRKNLNASSEPVRVLWRGVDERDFTAYWCVRLANGDYGFLGKVGRRFIWVEGSRDDTFATVPDELFEEAAETARLRDR